MPKPVVLLVPVVIGTLDYCLIHGHETTTYDGLPTLFCPRCGFQR